MHRVGARALVHRVQFNGKQEGVLFSQNSLPALPPQRLSGRIFLI